MNRDRAKELLPIIEAFGEGAAIQVDSSSGWYDEECPSFGNDASTYRIKPEPEVIWVNKKRSGEAYKCHNEPTAKLDAYGKEDEFEYIAKKFIAAE